MSNVFTRFHPDLFQTVFNYDAIGVVTSVSDNHLKVTGHFRTSGDYIGLLFCTEDTAMHNHCKYPTNFDYRGTVLKFSTVHTGASCNFNDRVQQPSITVRTKDDSQYYVTLGFMGTKRRGSSSFSFDGTPSLSHEWIDWGTLSGHASWKEWVQTGTDEEGNPIGEWIPHESDLVFGRDFDVDFVNGRLFTTECDIGYQANCTLNYTYNDHSQYIINFDKLVQGTHPNLASNVPANEIARIDFPMIPHDFTTGKFVMTGRSDLFTFEMKGIEVTGGVLGTKKAPMEEHKYRIAEGFDDEYNKNPKRLAETTFDLGYRKIVNLYIGASHFYDKFGQAGVESEGYKSMVLDHTKGINSAFREWMDSYLFHLKRLGFAEFVMSVSMENLQMPSEWKQLLYDGSAGGTGWTPPTNFYSPNCEEVKTYIRTVSKELLDILINHDFPPILQLGEPWWWWQEFELGNVQIPYEGRPPCFYDEHTLKRFEKETGHSLPRYTRTDIMYNSDVDNEVTDKLCQYLGEYSDFMKSIALEYENSQYTVLFFPPSVLDKGRVPTLMRRANTPFDKWDNKQLDFIQIEDYDWIVHNHPDHVDVYTFAWYELGYNYSQQHYFTGFAWEQFGIPIEEQWYYIEKAGATALARGFREVFVWAGTQIRRDSWVPRKNYYGTDTERWLDVNIVGVNDTEKLRHY